MQQPPNPYSQFQQQPQQQPNYTQPQTYYPPQQEWQQSNPLPPQQQQWQQPPYYPPPYQPPEKPRNAFKLGLGIGCGILAVFAIGIVVLAIVVSVGRQISTVQNPNALPTEQVFNAAYQPVDGIYCDQLEQTAYHIHVHLTIYINGQPVAVPQGVGIASDQSCFYWLHTHDSTGVVHIEAPQTASLTLQNFLDIWGQEFSQLGFQNELASSAGWTIYVNGQQVHGDFTSVGLTAHELITIAYNSPGVKPETTYNWPQGL